jgi:hypothetical protein
MNQRAINIVCLLLAAAGIGFGVGQSTGQDGAQASARANSAWVVFVRDTAVRHELFEIGVNIYGLCKALMPPGTSANGCVFPP